MSANPTDGEPFTADLAVSGQARPKEGTRSQTGGRCPSCAAAYRRVGELLNELADAFEDLAHEAEIQLDEQGGLERVSGSVEATLETQRKAPLLAATDIAKRLSVDPKTVRRWRTQGELPPAIEIGGVVRWHDDDIEDWMRTRRSA